jgi:hypothetical protein
VSPAKTKTGERLPYVLSKLKAPRALERLEQTAALAREQDWPYERFLETLLEAEVFARDASGARMRIRHTAFPALKTLAHEHPRLSPAPSYRDILHVDARTGQRDDADDATRPRRTDENMNQHQLRGRNTSRAARRLWSGSNGIAETTTPNVPLKWASASPTTL